ncbi:MULTISPECIES: 2OG-Fe(II) oxygenase family protein [unclassified Undibacterium]|uniref:2OG-Fe(II) oxygenase family protein n=1 Tax=unclassified Undibacterium TaxID=2630295 RepID=UPI002AC8EED1|nr:MULTISPECIES: 2OG-Fe(II) oxygenase family protein [unclassified Undibacterium]MEB0140462.1 2OG-Fe(II) oxygenase family protein [Undibacterium sp. CCC2.1]MEB0173529.1 2OG-Fe(II) oxygenase family protein [Undibacterium sp. CCC1.1]MEB0177455.1 2OG-Fe(II) oxygenase family protein [Undibacterium sp. CCC3.4]MEB0214355.1 2OG-Fe(II) oxygenase family protein [Undibacterium sp. 5I2]WPX44225.1 2OG-Fe(II) oxygenase family protein [Undibacterium sp. CCC3.4]
MFIVPVDYRDPDAAKKFTESLHQTGFGVLTNHPLSSSLLETIYREWYDFFQSDAKLNYPFDAEKMDGYFSPQVSETAKGYTKRDLKEFYHIYPWGRLPAEVSNAAREYYQAGSTLAAELLQWVEQHSPAEIKAKYSMPLSDMISDSELTLLRVLHYPPLRGDEDADAVRAAAHGDINLLTVLPAATQAGLQVLGKDQAWHDVPCDFGMLIVNIGDMLDEASQGYYPSTIHRVLNPSGAAATQSRISLPLFLHPRPDVVLSERHTSGSYLQERLRELGVKK